MSSVNEYLSYVSGIRRYSPRTVEIYRDVLNDFSDFAAAEGFSSAEEAMRMEVVRGYEVSLLDARAMSPATVLQHLSVLGGYARFLVRQGVLDHNPVRGIRRPKTPSRVPVFYRRESIDGYFVSTEFYASAEAYGILGQQKNPLSDRLYVRVLERLIMSVLYNTGIRRAELVALDRSSLDFFRGEMKVHGKGDKVRTIPLPESLLNELSMYMELTDGLSEAGPSPLLLTPSAGRLYPVYVDRAVKHALQTVEGVTCRRSPHVLRHTIASELLDEGADINSIKEFLGHSSLAATQIYTHSSVEKLKSVYNNAHPRAKKA